MKICVFSPFSNLKELAELTVPNKRKYCDRHGYELLTPPLGGTGCNFDEMYGLRRRMPLVVELLKTNAYDWVWVVGVDVLITNMATNLRSILDEDYGMVVGTEPTGVGMDSYLIRSRKGGLEFLERVVSHKDAPLGAFQDQSTIDTLCRQEPELLKVVKLVPQRQLNAYKYEYLHQYGSLHPGFVTGTDCLGQSEEWQPGDFVLHVPGIGDGQKLTILQETLPLIQE